MSQLTQTVTAQAVAAQETVEDRLAKLLFCYASGMETVAESLAVISPEIGRPYSRRLSRLSHRLAFGVNRRALEESRTAFRSEVRGFSEIIGTHIRELTGMVHASHKQIESASQTIHELTRMHCRLIEILCTRVEDGADLDDAIRFKAMMKQQITGLRYSSEKLLAAVGEGISRIAKASSKLTAGIENPECLEEVDAETGLLTRWAARRQVEICLEAGTPFSALVLKIDEYREISPGQAALLVKEIAGTLVDLVRPVDIVSRWARDRFFLMLACGLAEAEERAQQISAGLTRTNVGSQSDEEEQGRTVPGFTMLYWQSNESMDLWDLIARIDGA